MAPYRYRAKDRHRQIVEGLLEADSDVAAIEHLGRRGLYPITLTAASAATERRDQGRVSRAALARMSRQLADLVGGGLPLANALMLVAEQIDQPVLRAVVADVGAAVHGGESLSAALARHPAVFPPLYVGLVAAGEVGGGLDGILLRLAELLERDADFRGRLLAALVYPVVVLGLGLITVVVLLTYVVPTISALFAETGQRLPLPTRLLLAVSDLGTRWWWAILLAAIAAAAALRSWRRSAAGRRAMDRTLLRIPLVGDLVRKQQTARLARQLSALLGQGVPLLQALAVANATVANTVLRGVVERAREAVRGGQTLAGALAASGQLPVAVGHLVAVGEASGSLERALAHVAAGYEREADRALRVLTALLEPLLIIVVGVVVMGIVMAMLLPIFQLGMVTE